MDSGGAAPLQAWTLIVTRPALSRRLTPESYRGDFAVGNAANWTRWRRRDGHDDVPQRLTGVRAAKAGQVRSELIPNHIKRILP
jgi:hypothetical protein